VEVDEVNFSTWLLDEQRKLVKPHRINLISRTLSVGFEN